MLKRSLLFTLLASFVFPALPTHAANVSKRTVTASPAVTFWTGASPYVPGGFYVPSSADNWLGGTGNWSSSSHWSAGLPGSGSDVNINTNYDYVTLDTSASINSLTLGGTSGLSTLIDPNSSRYTLNIAGALTINQSGTLTLTGDIVNAGANSLNSGTLNLESGSGLRLAGDFANYGNINFANIGGLAVGGTFTNVGMINDEDIEDAGGSTLSAGNLNNSGTITILSMTVTGAITNSGIMNVGALNVGSMVNGGAVYGALSSGNQFNITGELNNSGYFDTSYSVATIGSVRNSGQFIVGGTVTVQGDFDNSYQLYEDNIDRVGQSLTIAGTLTNEGGAMIQMEGPVGGISAKNLVNSGTITLMNSSPLTVSQNVTNSGTIVTGQEIGGNDAVNIGGKLTNTAGSAFQLLGIGDSASIGTLLNSGTITVANGATLTVPVSTNAAGNALAGFLNSGSVLIQQGGTISSYGKYTQTAGQTTVDGHLAGIINFAGGSVYGNNGTISGSTTSNASINFGDAPLTVGQLNFMGNYTQGGNGSLTFDIASVNSYDKMDITGQAHLNGMMTIDLLHGYVPQVGNMFEIMTFAGESGTFSNVVGLPINSQEHFTLQYNSSNLTLDVVSGPLAGLSALKTGSSSNEPFIQIAEAGSPSQMSMSGGSLQTTPEPGSIILFGSGVVGLIELMRRRRIQL